MVKDKLLFKNVKVIQNNISDQAMFIEVIINGNYVSVLSIYAPTEVAEKQEKKDFYTLLQSTVTAISPTNTVIIMGDFNARMGYDEDIDNGSNILGKYANAFTNKNGQLLVDFCHSQKFEVFNSFFKRGFVWFWKNPRTKKWNQIGHMLYKGFKRNTVQFCCVDIAADCWSDQRLLKMKIFLNSPITYRRWKKSTYIYSKLLCLMPFKNART